MKKYSKTLVNYLQQFCGEGEKGEYLFTNGVIYLADGLTATDRRIYVHYNVSGVPQSKLYGSYIDDKLVSNNLNFNPLLFTMKPTTGSITIDFGRWEKVYEKVKKYKRPKSFGKSISPGECVKLCDGLYVLGKTFNKFVKICQKEDISLIRFNNNVLIAKNEDLTVAEVNYQNSINFDFDDCQEY